MGSGGHPSGFHWGSSEITYQRGCPSCSRRHLQVKVFYFYVDNLCCQPRPNNTLNRHKILVHSLGTVVCYRKDNPAGTQFLSLPSDLTMGINKLVSCVCNFLSSKTPGFLPWLTRQCNNIILIYIWDLHVYINISKIWTFDISCAAPYMKWYQN